MAKAKNLVKASAQIITITELTQGDVYQRLEGSTDLRYGLVTQVLHNGTDAVIQALEIRVDYYGPSPEVKTFGTDSDVKIFPADPINVRMHLDEVAEKNEQTLTRAQKALDEAVTKHRQVKDILDRYQTADLTAATVEYGPASSSL